MPDLADRIPEHAVEAEETADGRVDLVRRNASCHWIDRLLSRWFKPPDVRVHLDDLGTAVWRAIDGERTTTDILAGLEQTVTRREGEDSEQLRERLALFLVTLEGSGFVRFR